MILKKRILFLALLGVLVHAEMLAGSSNVKLPYFFGSQMVLQRQKPIRFWGTARADAKFIVIFAGNKKNVQAGMDGKWTIEFPAREAGGPFDMKVESDSSFSFKNILIGDVWLCSGQSNMEWTVKQSFNAPYELARANYPNIRSFTVAREINSHPVQNVSNAQWQISTPENTASFSAVAYYFARSIHQSQRVPIGIIHSSWGGTMIEPWIGLPSIAQHPDFKLLAESYQKEVRDGMLVENSQRQYAADMDLWMKDLTKTDQGFTEKWHSPSYPPDNWKKMIAPAYWEDHGLADFDGVVWLRKEIMIPTALAGKSLLLNLETLKDTDISFFNGIEVGRTSWQPGRRIYVIPGKLVKAGKNLIALRIENTSDFGGFTSRNAIDLRLQELVESANPVIIPLSGEWAFKSTLKKGEYPDKPIEPVANRRKPSVIYNAMIAPFEDFGLKGFLWYQGEGNASEAAKYRKLLPLLIENWRGQFKQGDLPFLIVQLAGFGALTPTPVESGWAELRESQESALTVSNTGLAVTVDLGNPYDVHPVFKQQVGERLASEARRLAYGESKLQNSPLFLSKSIENNKMRLRFRNADAGLISRNGPLKGFAIAGEDGKFVWASAKIEGNEVVVWNDNVVTPLHVRYAWTGSPVESNGANLFNKAGFPAAPFRTDTPNKN